MTDTSIQERLKIVAEFDGYTERPEEHLDENYLWFENENGNGKYLNSLKYHTDYNELHRVWVKFRDYPVPSGYDDKHDEMCINMETDFMRLSITSAFDALYTSIQWLNSIKQNEAVRDI